MRLQYGHWVSLHESGVLTYSDMRGETGVVDLAANGNVLVVIKTGYGERPIVKLGELRATVAKLEAEGNYVREVFVANTGGAK